MTVPVPTVPAPVVLSTDENPFVEAPVVANSMKDGFEKKAEGGRKCPKCGTECENGLDCVAGLLCVGMGIGFLVACATGAPLC